jgi:hypothetical protein
MSITASCIFYTILTRQFGHKGFSEFHSDNVDEYISNELNRFVLNEWSNSRVNSTLLTLESNGIVERFNQTITIIGRSMTIAAPDFPCL